MDEWWEIQRNKMSVIFVKGHFKVNANYNKPLGKQYRKGWHWKTISTVRGDVNFFFLKKTYHNEVYYLEALTQKLLTMIFSTIKKQQRLSFL